LHGDLHPGNVILSEAGAILIDWTDASAGVRAADVAETWTLISCFDPGGSHVDVLRAPLLDAFFADVDIAAARPWLERVAQRRLADPNTSPVESARIKALCMRNEQHP
jgi:Ser/Thr protein kinase RdoA (MazF antagonist)